MFNSLHLKCRYNLNTLLLKHFEFDWSRRPILLHKKITPLLQVKVMHYRTENIVSQSRKVVSRFRFDRILILYANYQINVYRSKLINKKREIIIDTLNKIGKKNLMYYIQLNRVNEWVSDEQLKKHLQFALSKQVKNQISCTDPLEMIKNFPNCFKSWILMQNPQAGCNYKLISMAQYQSTYNNILFSNLYFLESCPEKQNVYEDIVRLLATLKKFNIFKYFLDLKSNDHKLAYKLCERFIKIVKWKSLRSQKYLLKLMKSNSNIWIFFENLNTFVIVYQKYYKNIN